MERFEKGEDLLNDDDTIKYENKLLTLDSNPSFSYVYCADSRYKPELNELIHGVNLLYHEATFADDMKDRTRKTYCTTVKQVAQFAKDAKVERLTLGHFSSRYKELDSIIEEAKAIFPNSEIATEGIKFVIGGK